MLASAGTPATPDSTISYPNAGWVSSGGVADSAGEPTAAASVGSQEGTRTVEVKCGEGVSTSCKALVALVAKCEVECGEITVVSRSLKYVLNLSRIFQGTLDCGNNSGTCTKAKLGADGEYTVFCNPDGGIACSSNPYAP